jgi:DNA-binding transcriptional ArsR family regulator
MLGAARQQVNRHLKALERAGLIRTRYSAIYILDQRGLLKRAHPEGISPPPAG